MKTYKLLSIFGMMFFANIQLISQVNLPYYSGFNDSIQQNGWTEYKTASTQFSHWEIYAQVGHDYSPSTGITLTDNWLVSPGFSLENGGFLDSIRYSFSGFSTPENEDTIAIYLLNGSQNPDLATSKTLLYDFRGTEYLTDNTYRIKTGIELPAQNDLSYLAIRYRNTDCSSKWLTVVFDDIAISAKNDLTAINSLKNQKNIKIYPNPSTNYLQIKNILKGKYTFQILDISGKVVFTKFENIEADFSKKINLKDLSEGFYFLKISNENGSVSESFQLVK